VDDIKTKDREVKNLGLGLEELGLKDGVILTENYEKYDAVAGRAIKYKKTLGVVK
jgi:hypothetical protein